MRSKMMPECPLCHLQYRALPRHLVDRHLVLNKDERNILLRMANGRISIRLEPCSAVGCSYHGTRLDRHLDTEHPELSQQETDLSLQEVKRKVGLKMLRELREADPPVHMITTLDVEYDADDEHPDSFSGEVDLEADERTTIRLLGLENVAQKEALNKEVCFVKKKLKHFKASSAKRDIRCSGIRSSGRYTPLVELGRPQSKDAGDEESRGEGLRRPMSAPPSVNQLDLSRRRATMPSSSRVKCKSKKKHTSHEHGAISKTARDKGQGGVGTRRKSATPRPTGRSNPAATGRYTPGLLEAMEDTSVNAIGAKVAPSDELQGDCEDSDDQAMADVDEPEMAIEVTELLMGQKQPSIPTFSGIMAPVTQPTLRINRLHSSKLNAAAIRSAQASSTTTPVLLRKTIARRAKRALAPVAGKTSPTLPRPSGCGLANTMWHTTLLPSMDMTEYRDYNAGIDPDTKLSENVQPKVKRYQDPSNRYYASNPGVKEALGIRHMFTDSIAQATMDAQAEAGIEPEAAGPPAPPAPEPEPKAKPKRKRKTSPAPPAPEPEPEPKPKPKRKRKTSPTPPAPEPEPKPKRKLKTSPAPPAPEPKAKPKRKRKTSPAPPAPEPEPEPEPERKRKTSPAPPAPEPEPKRKRKRKTSPAPTQPKAGRAPVHCPEFSSSSSDDGCTLDYHYTTSDPPGDESDVKFQAALLERAKKRNEETLLDSADDDSDNPFESTCLSKTLQKRSR